MVKVNTVAPALLRSEQRPPRFLGSEAKIFAGTSFRWASCSSPSVRRQQRESGVGSREAVQGSRHDVERGAQASSSKDRKRFCCTHSSSFTAAQYGCELCAPPWHASHAVQQPAGYALPLPYRQLPLKVKPRDRNSRSRPASRQQPSDFTLSSRHCALPGTAIGERRIKAQQHEIDFTLVTFSVRNVE